MTFFKIIAGRVDPRLTVLAKSMRSMAEAATNKLFRSALLELPERGPWEFEATVDGGRGQRRVQFMAEAADRPPGWLAMAPWIGWPTLAILLFAIHQMLMRRQSRRRA